MRWQRQYNLERRIHVALYFICCGFNLLFGKIASSHKPQFYGIQMLGVGRLNIFEIGIELKPERLIEGNAFTSQDIDGRLHFEHYARADMSYETLHYTVPYPFATHCRGYSQMLYVVEIAEIPVADEGL